MEGRQQEIERRLGFTFQRSELVLLAFVDRSSTEEEAQDARSNRRLAFLGDAVIEFVLREHLFLQYPGESDPLGRWRSYIASNKVYATIVEKMDLVQFLLIRTIEGYPRSPSPRECATLFEAVIAATYLEHGIEAVRALLKVWLFPSIPDLVENEWQFDPKAHLLVLTRKLFGVEPKIEHQISFRNRKPLFSVRIHAGTVRSDAQDDNETEAEKEAARKAVRALRRIEELSVQKIAAAAAATGESIQ